MKKIILGFLSLFLVVGITSAQQGKKALKKASKELRKYNQNPEDNKDKLATALELVRVAFESDEVKNNPESYVTKGEIYNELANGQMKAKLLDPSYQIKNPDAGLIAYEAFTTAIEKATKKHHTKDALNGMQELEGHLNNIGVTHFEKKDYSGAFDNFSVALQLHEILKQNEKESRLDEPGALAEQRYFTAVCGYYGNRYDEAKPLLMELYNEGTDKAIVYEALFNIESQNDADAAYKYLEEGRAKVPEDTGLLFAEINYYLQSGRLEALIDKLKMAAEAEPDNMSVLTTMGSVYDQLNQKEREAGNIEQADLFFDLAYDNYSTVLAKDEDNFEATYSLGALYYNKAASLTNSINELSSDFTPAGTKKYEALKAEMDGYFKKALPFFETAESMDPNDPNTLIALKEIYARNNEFEKSKAIKDRLDALTGGQ